MSLLRTDRRGRVVVLTLDDPDRRNALTPPLVDAIVAAVAEAEEDEGIGALVVTGAPPAFCAGADLGDLARTGGSDTTAEAGLRAIYEGFLAVARCPLPTVAAVNGPAVGAGMNLALGCDLRVVGPGARFESRFLDIALHPGGGHTWLTHRLLGPQGAAAAVLFGQRIGAQEAVQRGLAWKLVGDGDGAVVDEAVALAERAAEAPRELAVRVKASLRAAALASSQQDALDLEIDHQLWSAEQPEFREKLAELSARISGRS